ncbi:hypothetical protein OH764_32720 (plasmid) [Burkholderia sp. M6-3]
MQAHSKCAAPLARRVTEDGSRRGSLRGRLIAARSDERRRKRFDLREAVTTRERNSPRIRFQHVECTAFEPRNLSVHQLASSDEILHAGSRSDRKLAGVALQRSPLLRTALWQCEQRERTVERRLAALGDERDASLSPAGGWSGRCGRFGDGLPEGRP